MTDLTPESLVDRCKRLEAFETPRWAIEAILDVELTTRLIFDPCAGLGAIGEVCRERRVITIEQDIENWSVIMPEPCRIPTYAFNQGDFFEMKALPSNTTVMMNPPFSRAEEFVDHALKLGARKVICFQRYAWRESQSRRRWWEENAPARVWLCGARASCWRFDLVADAEHDKRSNTPTAHAWFVWERGHKGAEVTSAIYPGGVA